MRVIDDGAIAAAGAIRRKSEYHYALFEYLRSPKILLSLERCGIRPEGRRILDAGCGAGGTCLSLAEESPLTVGLDLDARFRGTGTRLAREKGIANARFVQGDGARLPFRDGVFDLVVSHEVVEHVYAAEAYVRECARVLRPGGVLYLSTAPHLSLTGAHLPRLRLPFPLHLVLGRRLALRILLALARNAPWLFRDPVESSSFLLQARQGKEVRDSLLQLVTVRKLSGWIDAASLRRLHEERRITGFFRRALPGPVARLLARQPGIQDVMIAHIECVLQKGDEKRGQPISQTGAPAPGRFSSPI
jgi:SAM-dependent methyltransferase